MTADSPEPIPQIETVSEGLSLSEPSSSSMQEYYALQKELYFVTVAFTGVIFFGVWGFYSLATSLSYLLGACVGVLYLRLLAKNVEQIGQSGKQVSPSRFALLIGIVVIATQRQELEVLPVLLGFFTYKLALLAHMLRITLVS